MSVAIITSIISALVLHPIIMSSSLLYYSIIIQIELILGEAIQKEYIKAKASFVNYFYTKVATI